MTNPHSDGAVGQYRPDIDGLRAIAITAVVAFHAGLPYVTGGFVGVDIFFVLSGFLITSMLFKEAELMGRIDLLEFYARRVRRLLPAASIVLMVSVILAYFFLLPMGDEQLKFARSAAAAALFASNIYFWKSSGGYFDGPSDQIPLLHTWSLSVEEQFYLIWPILLIGLVRLSKWRGLKLRKLVLAALAGMFFCSLATSIWLSQVSPSAGFYLLPSRVWELAAGAFVGVFLQNNWVQQLNQIKENSKLNRFTTGLACTGVVAICYSVISFDASMAFPGWMALLPVVGTVAVLVAGALCDRNLISKLLSTSPMVMIGKLSYSWYLWHWPLLAFVKVNNFGDNDLSNNLIIIFVALIFAYLTHHFIENPIRYNKPWAFVSRNGALKSGVAMVVSTMLVTLALLGVRQFAQETDWSKKIDYANSDYSPLRFKCSRIGSKPLETLKKAECEVGNKAFAETIVVWGDSHSDHWMPLILDYFKEYRIIQYSMPGCPPLIGNPHPSIENCKIFNDLVAESIRQNNNVHGVILAARWPGYAGSSVIQSKDKYKNTFSDASIQDGVSRVSTSLERTFKSIYKADLKILIMGATPEFKYPVPACIFRKSPEFCQSTRVENDAYREKSIQILREAVEKTPNTKLADGYNALCESEYCGVFKNGIILYSDGDHLTGSGAKYALKSMQTEFAWFAEK
jgi:peptidoglycan/LPS O-acetylase OafA/YrhL